MEYIFYKSHCVMNLPSISWYALCHDLVNFFSSIRNSLCDDDGSTNSSRSEANSTKTNMPFFVWPGTSSSSRFAANGLENWSPFYALRFIVCITWARPPTSNRVKSIMKEKYSQFVCLISFSWILCEKKTKKTQQDVKETN